MGTTKWASVVLLLILSLSGCESAEQKAQAQAQKAEAQQAQQAAEAARKLRDELGDEIVTNVKDWVGAGTNDPDGLGLIPGYHSTHHFRPSSIKSMSKTSDSKSQIRRCL